jgi:hypothetical protein
VQFIDNQRHCARFSSPFKGAKFTLGLALGGWESGCLLVEGEPGLTVARPVYVNVPGPAWVRSEVVEVPPGQDCPLVCP